MAQNHYQWTSASVLPPCEVYGIFGYTDVECQLGSVVRSPEQVNYAQYNQGFRNNKKIGQQTTPPSYANNQRVPQKSSLKLLLENYFINQSEQLQKLKIQTGFLNDSRVKLSSKVNSILYSQQMLETQIPQLAQQVVSFSQTSGIFPSQPEANPKGQMNDITLRNGRQLEDPVVETKTIEVEVESKSHKVRKL